MISRMDFDMFFVVSIFDLKCIMGKFQNGLNSGIFGVFWSGFLDRTTPNGF